jgi:hypothetical protein
MTQENEPFWRRPLPPIPTRSSGDAIASPAADDGIVLLEVRVPDIEKEPEPVHVEPVAQPVEKPAVSQLDPYAFAKLAEHALDEARDEARQCRDATLKARTAFSLALASWNHGEPTQTQEQALRAYVDQSNLDRARRVAAGQGVIHPGITRTARAYQASGQRAGGGQSYRRGAVSAVEAMRIEAGKLRQAAATAAAKPPGGQS